ncbi:MAG: leucyl aminopeptidase [Alphaproteobacteria bacterium]|nr:leucyl aminopeptidase [Alphaproteobacteria bacterium]
MRISFGPLPSSAALAVFAHKDVVLTRGAQARDDAGRIARAGQVARFEGDTASILELLAPQGVDASRLLVVGLGAAGKADRGAFERIGGALAAKLLTSGETVLAIDMDGVDDIGVSRAEAAARIAYGALLRSYRFDKYRTKLKDKQKPSLADIVIANAGDSAGKIFERLKATADGVYFTRDLVSEPANVIFPESFVARCREAMAGTGITIEVLGQTEMAKLGMGALLGVAQGSVRQPQLLAMRWDGTGGAQPRPAVFVGKGVTFDTGGISIKPAGGMEDMKWDMGGAGAVAGAMLALAKRKAKAHVIGVCGLVENMPDGNAQRPGDVVTSMSGQTIEVINTDAEGRLVLCDAIWWAQETFNPEIVVDLATLTGAMIISLGHEHAGVFSNDDGLAQQLIEAGAAAGDPLWRLPMGDAYDKLIDSPIADMKNVGPRDGGSITAAQFIKRFVKDGVKWAHLDVAGTVWSAKAAPLWDKGATGYGVRLIDAFVEANLEAK